MTGWLLLPVVVAIVGLLVYAFASNGRASEIGRILFAVGALALCLILAGRHIAIGP